MPPTPAPKPTPRTPVKVSDAVKAKLSTTDREKLDKALAQNPPPAAILSALQTVQNDSDALTAAQTQLTTDTATLSTAQAAVNTDQTTVTTAQTTLATDLATLETMLNAAF